MWQVMIEHESPSAAAVAAATEQHEITRGAIDVAALVEPVVSASFMEQVRYAKAREGHNTVIVVKFKLAQGAF